MFVQPTVQLYLVEDSVGVEVVYFSDRLDFVVGKHLPLPLRASSHAQAPHSSGKRIKQGGGHHALESMSELLSIKRLVPIEIEDLKNFSNGTKYLSHRRGLTGHKLFMTMQLPGRNSKS